MSPKTQLPPLGVGYGSKFAVYQNRPHITGLVAELAATVEPVDLTRKFWLWLIFLLAMPSSLSLLERWQQR